MRVLIIDDDPILIMVCTRLMSITGFSSQVASCRDGKEGIEYLKAKISDHPEELPEIIFLDINMPVMNGWDFLDLYSGIKQDLPAPLTIVMLSSTVDQADYDRANTYPDVKGFYSKPLTKEHLPEITALMKSS